ncbi:MAG TPA: response regulator [Thermoanaerobaculia bacterium]|nr:response regulator [Thermoanaerobaculia bacterium]
MTRAGHRRVLVVDDDRGIRLLLATYLRRHGFQLLEAWNGREALVEMRAGNADVVILDLMMPEVSGMDVLRERAADPSLQWIPMIVVSANNRRQVIADVLDLNVRAVLLKPFDLDALLAAVMECLEPVIPAPLAA